MGIKDFVKKIVLREKADSKSYISYLRAKGISIGESCYIYAPNKTFIDVQYPWMITIGNNVKITEGVKLIAHDFSWSVIKTIDGSILGASGEINIGDNVFIGMNAIVTRNVKIGNNVIIGSGSVVTKDCDSDSVYAGNPAKRIMSIEEYMVKRAEKQIQEAKNLAIAYKKRYGLIPPKEIFKEYFGLFSDLKEASNVEIYKNQMSLNGNHDVTYAWMENHVKPFDDFESFINFCFEEERF